jgi:hypothetical protein
MLRKKNIKRVLTLELKIALAIVVLVVYFHDFIKLYIKPPVMEYVSTHIDFLKLLILCVFIFCSLFLILIVWLLEWGDKKQQSVVTKYVSQLVCSNYYGDYRRTDVYKAIKTCLSKFSRDGAQEEDQSNVAQDSRRRFARRHVDSKRFAQRTFPWEEKDIQSREKRADGVHQTFYKNGRLEKEISYKNNSLDGVFKTYYDDGRLHQEGCYKEGKLEGVYKAYDEDGILYFDMNYRQGKQDGITNMYFKNGVLQYRDTFKNGKRIFRETYSEVGELLFRQEEIIS